MPIGVDLGSREVKLAQLRTDGNGLELLALARTALDGSYSDDLSKHMSALAEGLRRALAAGPFHGRRCVLALPAAHAFVHHVRIPKLPPDQMFQALRLELQDKLPCDQAEAVARHIVVGDITNDGKNQQELIVVAATRKVLDAYLQMARSVRLDAIAVNIEACAIVECFSYLFRRSEDSARTMLFVDIGATSTQVVLSHGRKIVFARNLDLGGELLDEAVATGMGISVGEAHALRGSLASSDNGEADRRKIEQLLKEKLDEMAGEVAKCLRYYRSIFKNRSVELVIFLGGQAYDKGLCQQLANRLDLPATIGDPLARIRYGEAACPGFGLTPRRPRPDWAVAVGLSLSGSRSAEEGGL